MNGSTHHVEGGLGCHVGRVQGWGRVCHNTGPGMGSSPRCPLQSHYLVCIENNLFIVGIGPIINKELEFIYQYYRSGRMAHYTISFRYKNVTQSALFFAYKNR